MGQYERRQRRCGAHAGRQDVIVILENTSRDGEVIARFSGRNPDTPPEFAMKLDREGRTGWHITAGAEQAQRGRQLSPIQQAIVDIVQTAATPLTPMGIVAAARDGATKLNYSSVKVNCRRLVQRGFLRGENGSYQKIVECGETVVTSPVSLCASAISEGYTSGLQDLVPESPRRSHRARYGARDGNGQRRIGPGAAV